MDGVRVNCDSNRFPGTIVRAISPLFPRYWLVCTQGGPFSIADKPNFEQLSEEIDSFSVDVPNFRDTDVHLMRPGVFDRFGGLLVVDEWTYLFALDGPEEVAIENALKIDESNWLSSRFFEIVESNTLGFFLYVLGFWEIYLPDSSSQTSLFTQNPVSKISSKHWVDDRLAPD